MASITAHDFLHSGREVTKPGDQTERKEKLMKRIFQKLRRFGRRLAPIWLILLGLTFAIKGAVDLNFSELLIGLLCAVLGAADRKLLRKQKKGTGNEKKSV